MNFWEKKFDLDKTRFLYEFFLNPIFLRSTRAADHKINMLIVQSLDSPFFPPHIGAEPGRAKEESGITCMRMLRTNQSKINSSQPRYSRQCVAQCLSQLAL